MFVRREIKGKVRRELPSTEAMVRFVRMHSGDGVSIVEILEQASIAACGRGHTLDEVLYGWVRTRESLKKLPIVNKE